MKKILLWDPRQAAANPLRLQIDDALASACVRAGVAAAADPIDAQALSAGGPVDPSRPIEIMVEDGVDRILRKIVVPTAVAKIALQLAVGAIDQDEAPGPFADRIRNESGGFVLNSTNGLIK